jgi:hypothetical protein
VEGLRLDEAMHPLTLLGVGMFGEEMPPQDGAPVAPGGALAVTPLLNCWACPA